MVCTANELLEWKDFPKGLRVLLLDEDHDSASEIKSKLEQMEYLVTTICSEHEALSTISNKNDVFHVAIVEVSTQNSDGRYKLLEAAKDLPTIMTSKEHCLSTMMKCIALGAVEFLTKPLSEDKLRNIWQHVVHKAFNASGNAASESPKSVKEFVGSVLEIQHQNTVLAHNQASEGPEDSPEISQNDNENEYSSNSDKFPAPSTPQLKHGGRSFDHGDCQDLSKTTSPLKESGELDGEITKSVDITYGDSNAKMEVDPPDQPIDNLVIKEEKTTSPLKKSGELDGEITKSVDITYGDSNANMEVYPPDQPIDNDVIKEENDTSDCSQGKDDTSSMPLDKDVPTKGCDNITGKSNTESTQNSCGAKANRKKIKVDWTPELHKKFVQAVEKLGVDQAIPSRILELMKVEGLTRHNVASHLQKYRMNRRHILPKEENRRWPHPRDSMQRSYYPHRPVIAYPPYQTNHTMPPGHVYPVWGPQHGVQPPHLPMWGSPPSYPWQPMENWHWQPYPGMHAEAWGCPVLPPPPCPSSNFPHQVQGQGTYGFNSPDGYGIRNSSDPHPGEEVIDKVVKEAISKPWLPLPIGLKPPSTDSVLAELSRQGISTVPPHLINGRHPC